MGSSYKAYQYALACRKSVHFVSASFCLSRHISSFSSLQHRHGFFSRPQISAASSSLGMQSDKVFGPMGFQTTPFISANLGCLGRIAMTRDLSHNIFVSQSDPEKEDNIHPREKEDDGGLPGGLRSELMPKHVAIIMDGNSRWAKMRGLPQFAGHAAGVKTFLSIVKLSSKWSIRVLTVYAFSTENWSRPKGEVDCLMGLFETLLSGITEMLHRENIQFCSIGDVSKLPNLLQRSIANVKEITKENSGLKLVFAVSYSGRDEIVQACQRLAGRVEAGQLNSTDITESLLEQELETTSCVGDLGNPDLVIRTSGEHRLSNFLLWQSAYSELYFEDTLWPNFGEAQYAEALKCFQQRHRRFGKRVSHNEISEDTK